MLWKSIFIACNAITASFLVLVVMILGFEKALKLGNSSRELDPIMPCLSMSMELGSVGFMSPFESFIRFLSTPEYTSQSMVVSEASGCGAKVLATRSAVQCFPNSDFSKLYTNYSCPLSPKFLESGSEMSSRNRSACSRFRWFRPILTGNTACLGARECLFQAIGTASLLS
jgi:hypothetical protein